MKYIIVYYIVVFELVGLDSYFNKERNCILILGLLQF